MRSKSLANLRFAEFLELFPMGVLWVHVVPQAFQLDSGFMLAVGCELFRRSTASCLAAPTYLNTDALSHAAFAVKVRVPWK